MRIFAVFCLISMSNFLWFCSPCFAESSVSQEMCINSDSLVFFQDRQKMVFSGNVYVTYQDFEMWTKELTVFLNQTVNGTMMKNPVGNMSKILASGDVRVKNGKRFVTAQQGVFDAQDETVRLTGKPMLQEGENTLRGDEVILHLKEQTSEVKGGKKRVEAIFFPNAEKSEDL